MTKYIGKTIETWADLKDKRKIYDVGSLYETEDKERFEEVLGNNKHNRPFIEVVEIVEEGDSEQDLSKLKKDELQQLLAESGLEFDEKETKAELISKLEQAE